MLYGVIAVLVVGGIGIFALNSGNSALPAQDTDVEISQQTSQESMDEQTSQKEMTDDAAVPATGTVVDVAAGNPDFSTLVAAAKAAGLVEALSGPGPITVFAPTNAAFAKLPEGTVESLLLPENKEKLATVLKYHVVSGAVMSTDLSDGQKPQTLAGQTVTIDVSSAGVKVNDSQVVTADLKTSNGVIHVIDTVLLPE